jgi:two-component system, response regulator
VEDDENDAFLMKRALAQSGIHCEHVHFLNAHRAMDALEKMSPSELNGPQLIISDLKMFGMSGLEFTRWVRASRFGSVPVVLLTGSCLVEDILAAYGSGANAFVTKPASFVELSRIVGKLISYWKALSNAPRLQSH